MQQEQFFEGLLLFLLADQQDDLGTWGRSITKGEKLDYATLGEKRILETATQIQSLTVSYMAVKAIREYTRDQNNPAIKKLLENIYKCRRKSENDKINGYGSEFHEEKGSRYAPKRVPEVTVRHTACALLILILFKVKFDQFDIESIIFLLDQSGSKGGWPNDLPDVLTSIYVLALLTSLSQDIIDMMNPSTVKLLDEKITLGIDWLKKQSTLGLWIFSKGRILRDTAEVLYAFPQLKNYDLSLYRQSIKNLVDAQKPDHGWPNSPGEESDLRATLWIMRAIADSGQEYIDKLKNGLKFVLEKMTDKNQVKELSSEHWALLVDLHILVHRDSDIYPTETRLKELYKLAFDLQKKAFEHKDHDTHFLHKGEYKKFVFLSPAVSRVFQIQGFQEVTIFEKPSQWLRMRPKWVQWLVGTGVAIIIGLIITLIGRNLL
ncbi:MAG: hypothetical protein ACREBB_00795 [Nitrosotalea sp.]